MKIVKPSKLKKGDTIGLISNSSPLADLVPHRTKRAIKMFESLGFKVKIGNSALKITNHTAGTPEERAKDINDFIIDKNIKAIISFIGGNHSNQLLNLLDYQAIKNNPKIIMGYSDTTVLLLAIYKQTGLVTFYGPAGLTQFGENPKILDYTLEYFNKAVMSNEPIGKILPSSEWTDEALNWFTKKDTLRRRKLRKNDGWQWLKQGKVQGKLIGGCITSMMHLRGTKYWPDFTDSILFWEIPEGYRYDEGEPPAEIDSYLTDLELSGVFSKINGMVVGRPYHYNKQDEKQLKKIIIERTKKYNFPILYRVDFGHTDPVITIPIGVQASLDSSENHFAIDDTGVC